MNLWYYYVSSLIWPEVKNLLLISRYLLLVILAHAKLTLMLGWVARVLLCVC